MVKAYTASGYNLEVLLANIPVEESKIISISHSESFVVPSYREIEGEDEEGTMEVHYGQYHKIVVFYHG